MISAEADRDRRAAPRVFFSDRIEIVGDETQLEVSARDLSTDGISIDDESLEHGRRVRVRFVLGDSNRRVDSLARVVRRGHGHTGLIFEDMAWMSRANLADFVTSVRRGTPYPPPVWH